MKISVFALKLTFFVNGAANASRVNEILLFKVQGASDFAPTYYFTEIPIQLIELV